MPKVRDVLIHASVEIAGKKRKCCRKPGKHAIAKGEPCLVIKSGPYNSPKSYCCECAKEILDVAPERIADFRQSLS